MVELGYVFPILKIVTLLAVRSEAAVVLIFVAGGAGLWDAEKSSVAIAHLNTEAFRGRNMIGSVAAITGQTCMFALEDVAGFTVVETCRSGRPLNEREVLAVMFRVTFGAALAGIGLQIVGGVQSPVSLQARGNLGVTLQAFQFALGADLVTRGAVGGAF